MNDKKKKICLTVLGLVILAVFVFGIMHFRKENDPYRAENYAAAEVSADDPNRAVEEAQAYYNMNLENELNTPCGTATSRKKNIMPNWLTKINIFKKK